MATQFIPRPRTHSAPLAAPVARHEAPDQQAPTPDQQAPTPDQQAPTPDAGRPGKPVRPAILGDDADAARRKIALHNAKVMIALQSALLRTPGMNSGDDVWRKAIRDIADLYCETLAKVLDHLEADGQSGDWLKLKYNLPVAEMVSAMWAENREVAMMRGPANLADTFIKWTASLPADLSRPSFEESGLSLVAEMTLTQSGAFANLAPTLLRLERMDKRALPLYLGKTPIDEFRDDLYRLMQAHAPRITDSIAPKDAVNDKSRLITYKSVARHVGKILGAVLDVKFNRLLADARNMREQPQEKRQEYLKWLDGLPEGALMIECRKGLVWALRGAYPDARSAITENPEAGGSGVPGKTEDDPVHQEKPAP